MRQPTHGICARHNLPSRSFPGAELLIIVRRESIALYAQLKRIFAALSDVTTVVLERREAERRAVPRPDSCERRSERRILERTASGLGDFTMVRFTPKVPPAPDTRQRDVSCRYTA